MYVVGRYKIRIYTSVCPDLFTYIRKGLGKFFLLDSDKIKGRH